MSWVGLFVVLKRTLTYVVARDCSSFVMQTPSSSSSINEHVWTQKCWIWIYVFVLFVIGNRLTSHHANCVCHPIWTWWRLSMCHRMTKRWIYVCVCVRGMQWFGSSKRILHKAISLNVCKALNWNDLFWAQLFGIQY